MIVKATRMLTLIVSACCGTALAQVPDTVPNPAAPVETIQSALAAAAQQADVGERQALLFEAVKQSFDLPGASRLILRGAWRQLNADQHNRFVDALGRVIAANYASRFKPGVAVNFGRVEVTDLPRGRASVRTMLERAQGSPVAFDYVVQRSGEQWRILNVLVGGVSDIALRSAQYTRQLNEQGFDAVVAGMHAEAETALAEAK